ncbi:hypothetical protein NC652_011381 [Populus alba x Populus x berolinensis]|nr:hypothetical protein NC652_011381 [Populus alba x Populus x berolinensis]
MFPYGKTINEATGRPSDGLLIIDYIARSADLPLVVPYKNLSASHLSTSRGVNFAYSGATALSKEVLAKKNIILDWAKPSLRVQLGWLDDYFKGYCNNVKGGYNNILPSHLILIKLVTILPINKLICRSET